MQLHTMIDTVKSRGLTIEDWNIESHPIGKRYYTIQGEQLIIIIHDTKEIYIK